LNVDPPDPENRNDRVDARAKISAEWALSMVCAVRYCFDVKFVSHYIFEMGEIVYHGQIVYSIKEKLIRSNRVGEKCGFLALRKVCEEQVGGFD
jgi:hypothetical protein